MEAKKYLKEIVSEQTLKNDSVEMKALRTERDKVESVLKEKFKECNPVIKYGGSKAKGTMICKCYDLDIICYFEHEEKKAGETLKEIFENTEKALQDDYHVTPKTTALRLESKEPNSKGKYTHIDVVPGRYIDEKKDDVHLYINNADKDYMKTNPVKHIEHIRDSDLQDVIKLVKYWKERNNLQIKTFVLELLVIKLLKDCDPAELEKCLLKFWNEVKENYETLSVEDPANETGNDLSSCLDSTVRFSLYFAASNSLSYAEQDKWNLIFGELKTDSTVSNVLKVSIIESIRDSTPKPTKPWADTD